MRKFRHIFKANVFQQKNERAIGIICLRFFSFVSSKTFFERRQKKIEEVDNNHHRWQKKKLRQTNSVGWGTKVMTKVIRN